MRSVEQISSEISVILSSLKNSFDSTLARRRIIDANLEDVASIVGLLEQARFKFHSGVRIGARHTSEFDMRRSIQILQTDLETAFALKGFNEIASQLRFRLRPFIGSRGRPENFSFFDLSAIDGTSVLEVAGLLYNNIATLKQADLFEKTTSKDTEHTEISQEIYKADISKDVQNLKNIVPAQKVAPIQFKIDNDIIFLDKTISNPANRDKQTTLLAKEEILENGRRIVEHLQNSNCDKRLIHNVEHLHSQISGDANAIQIGISNISFGVMSHTFHAELPDAVSAMLQSHNISISMYVSQFPDWNRFSENASTANLSVEDIKTVDNSARHIIDYLDNHQKLAEPHVVQAFRKLRNFTANPDQANKRAVFAVIRSIENLLSKTFQYATSFIEETGKEVKKQGSKATATLIIVLGLGSATTLTPLIEKIDGMSWLKNAIEIVQKQLKLPNS